jgi:DNA primase
MIKQSSIDEIRGRADLDEIVSRYTTIKKNLACCPIHKEKSQAFIYGPLSRCINALDVDKVGMFSRF